MMRRQADRARWGLAVLCLLLILCMPVHAAEPLTENQAEVVFVAGNPDLYPLEYYDRETGTFAGILPDLFRQLSEQTGREYRYVSPSASDQRGELAKNSQVELVSGVLDGEGLDWNLRGRSAEIVTVWTEQGRRSVRIGWTSHANQEDVETLQSLLQDLTGQELAERILDASGQKSPSGWIWTVPLLLMFCVVLLILMGVLEHRHRKKNRTSMAVELIDPQTGLGNRLWFQEQYHRLLNDRNRVLYCVVYFGIDTGRLRLLQGPEEEERRIQQIGQSLSEQAPDGECPARVDNSGFALIHRYGEPAGLEPWIEKVLLRLRHQAEEEPDACAFPIRAGSYFLTAGDRDPARALFNAELGYQRAREAGVDHCTAGTELLQQSELLRQSLLEIRRGLDAEQFRLYLQPVVDAQTGEFIGAEALSRWQHPGRGLLGPGQFVELMEQEGLISLLDWYVLEHVCGQLQELSQLGMEKIYITCNFSPISLDSEAFWPQFSEILESYDFPRDNLVVEVTEGVMSKAPAIRRQNLNQLRQAGIAVALDDFGSGYTSFRELATQCYNYVKIDRDLLDSVDIPDGRSMVSGLIAFSHELKLKVLCEGVETKEQAMLLRDLGCDVFQGFYFCRPLPAREAVTLFRNATKES